MTNGTQKEKRLPILNWCWQLSTRSAELAAIRAWKLWLWSYQAHIKALPPTHELIILPKLYKNISKIVDFLLMTNFEPSCKFDSTVSSPNAPRPPGTEVGRRPAIAGAASFSKKAYVVFSCVYRESLMLICRGNLFRTKLGTKERMKSKGSVDSGNRARNLSCQRLMCYPLHYDLIM